MMSFRQSREIYTHIDCNSFFASCEVLRNPRLKGKCVCVGDQISIAASYEVKKFWIKTGTPMWEAERILGNRLIKILPDHNYYMKVSKNLMDYLTDQLWKIEVFSVDELFATVTDIGDSSTQSDYYLLAEKLKRDIYKNIGLPVSVGIANTRIKAKIFSELNKPFGSYTNFSKDWIEQLFKSLKVTDIPYIAKGNSERLGIWVKTIYDFYNLDPMKVSEILWKNWVVLWLELHWADVWNPHDTIKKRKSLICSRSFNHDLSGEYYTLWRRFLENLERAYDTLIWEKQEVKVIGVQLKDKEFQSFWEFQDIWKATIDRNIISRVARELFDRIFIKWKIYRTTWVQFSELRPYIPKQTSIFEIENKSHSDNDRLAWVMIKLKNIYWRNIINVWLAKSNKDSSSNNCLDILYEAW